MKKKKIVFVCHGNICRSPMAEYVFKHLLELNNLSDTCEVVSRATSREEIGNDIYPPAKRVLSKNYIPFTRHYAKQITIEEYNDADYIFVMEEYNIYNLNRLLGRVDRNKVMLLGDSEISDPWYDGRFDEVYEQIFNGCLGILKKYF